MAFLYSVHLRHLRRFDTHAETHCEFSNSFCFGARRRLLPLSSEQMVLIYPTHHSIGSDIIDHKTVNVNGASCKYFVPARKLIIE
ncbi:hypothetical protein E2R23_29275 [Burkholderia pseudomallei]|nr:hypothetical protein EXY28_29265 [Burkholderia pseudomallei]QBI50342.1 hypothetical protein EXY72_29310 [Burkholderia pseudomallei]QBL81597.1 hypothetical protein EYA82_29085 [Burkholderia pseudomallei]QBL88208.1 hypothetical protein EYA88_28815 [Burkholderia pseudomallei]QBP52083.1 hypothetical protein E2R28_29025 [Burkholderia pseudomallei]